MGIYVNRILNMKHIKAIGFDMDHTLVRYHSDVFEELVFNQAVKMLVNKIGYTKEIQKFEFNFTNAIRGLVVDKDQGNILKVSLYNKIKNACHGTKPLNYRKLKELYIGLNIDLNESRYSSIDTTFSIAFTVIYGQMIDLKNSSEELEDKTYADLADDILHAVDIIHRDGTLKGEVMSHLSKYIIKDPEIVEVLERFKAYDKKLWVITNSDYNYTRALLDYTINPYLKKHKHWSELIDITVTLSAKPRFFTDKLSFLKVDPATTKMENFDKKIIPGIYQGGDAVKLQTDMGLKDDEILYLGDHIYGDILKLKKTCGWRTALVIEELSEEVSAYRETKDISIEIDTLMEQKIELEKSIDDLYADEHEYSKEIAKKDVMAKFDEIEKLDKLIAKQIKAYEQHFNHKWGEVMRAGAEPSAFAMQVERYACIYMSKVSNFMNYSPRTYYRPKKRKIAHEM